MIASSPTSRKDPTNATYSTLRNSISTSLDGIDRNMHEHEDQSFKMKGKGWEGEGGSRIG